MQHEDYILAAYAITAVILAGMVFATWRQARRIARQLGDTKNQ